MPFSNPNYPKSAITSTETDNFSIFWYNNTECTSNTVTFEIQYKIKGATAWSTTGIISTSTNVLVGNGYITGPGVNYSYKLQNLYNILSAPPFAEIYYRAVVKMTANSSSSWAGANSTEKSDTYSIIIVPPNVGTLRIPSSNGTINYPMFDSDTIESLKSKGYIDFDIKSNVSGNKSAVLVGNNHPLGGSQIFNINYIGQKKIITYNSGVKYTNSGLYSNGSIYGKVDGNSAYYKYYRYSYANGYILDTSSYSTVYQATGVYQYTKYSIQHISSIGTPGYNEIHYNTGTSSGVYYTSAGNPVSYSYKYIYQSGYWVGGESYDWDYYVITSYIAESTYTYLSSTFGGYFHYYRINWSTAYDSMVNGYYSTKYNYTYYYGNINS